MFLLIQINNNLACTNIIMYKGMDKIHNSLRIYPIAKYIVVSDNSSSLLYKNDKKWADDAT